MTLKPETTYIAAKKRANVAAVDELGRLVDEGDARARQQGDEIYRADLHAEPAAKRFQSTRSRIRGSAAPRVVYF